MLTYRKNSKNQNKLKNKQKHKKLNLLKMDSNTILDPSLVCRLCTIDLMQFPECYAIDEEMENLIYLLTSISVKKKFLFYLKKF